jgi:hypothetical protein
MRFEPGLTVLMALHNSPATKDCEASTIFARSIVDGVDPQPRKDSRYTWDAPDFGPKLAHSSSRALATFSSVADAYPQCAFFYRLIRKSPDRTVPVKDLNASGSFPKYI